MASTVLAEFEPLIEDGWTIRFDEPLAKHTYMRLGGPAEIYAEPATSDQVVRLLSLASTLNLSVRILGAPLPGLRAALRPRHRATVCRK